MVEPRCYSGCSTLLPGRTTPLLHGTSVCPPVKREHHPKQLPPQAAGPWSQTPVPGPSLKGAWILQEQQSGLKPTELEEKPDGEEEHWIPTRPA